MYHITLLISKLSDISVTFHQFLTSEEIEKSYKIVNSNKSYLYYIKRYKQELEDFNKALLKIKPSEIASENYDEFNKGMKEFIQLVYLQKSAVRALIYGYFLMELSDICKTDMTSYVNIDSMIEVIQDLYLYGSDQVLFY